MSVSTSVPVRERTLSGGMILILAIACGMTVANLYYNQPLLADIARSFHSTPQRVGIVSMSTQIGYAIGMLVFVPLADIRERRRLISTLLIAVAILLIGVANAQTVLWLDIASFAVGFTTVVPQVIIPMVAHLANPGQRGKIIGTVMSGLLIGILLARTVAGYIGSLVGWRGMYWIAAVMMLVLFVVLRFCLPKDVPSSKLRYVQLIKSIGVLIVGQRTLREASFIGAMFFGAFSVFWTTLAFLLEEAPFHYGSQIAGLFGLVGVVGAMVAPIAGRLADKLPAKWIVGLAGSITLVAFVCFGFLGHTLWGLILGVILLDMGVQGAQILNQTRIYSLIPEARSRLNTVYMVSAFVGGAIGSSLGSTAWALWGWSGVSIAGGSMVAAGGIVWGLHRARDQSM
ncbi:MFS transporter [Alicyclobacillus sp. SO9]|uniref:MFS transporter n=1 Tax=Alicyclobacillus sp. SO9 TaxID=2665646 RepID=UPI0018E73E64|nr:MFS transporter [Alicyclobacillus sp. SO9]QQE79831.1 MFS transporter [Alicyclobacillus sp. SO9]